MPVDPIDVADARAGEARHPPATRRFWVSMAVIVGVGLAIRLVYVLVVKGDEAPRGDAITYFLQGHQVASGDGLVNAPLLRSGTVSLPAADHPPLFTYYLALLDLLGSGRSWGPGSASR